MRWFVGEVYMYFSHEQRGNKLFFAVVKVLLNNDLGRHGIPHVTKAQENNQFAVINVADIIRCVGLFRYPDKDTDYKVSWPYARYDDRMDGRVPELFSYL
ncbi:hypothetical protein G6F56_013824 [Rhizopus delemar]|nr:hypothetical protein G6F56_013824 [Rhizopus delemar]